MLLSAPLNIITQYEVLLERMLTHTPPDNNDYQDLVDAYSLMQVGCCHLLPHFSQRDYRILPSIFLPTLTKAPTMHKEWYIVSRVHYLLTSCFQRVRNLFADPAAFDELATRSKLLFVRDGTVEVVTDRKKWNAYIALFNDVLVIAKIA